MFEHPTIANSLKNRIVLFYYLFLLCFISMFVSLLLLVESTRDESE